MLDESNYPKGYGEVKIRYIGVFMNIKRAMDAIRYMFSLCSTKFCPKTSGDSIISEAICSKVLVWLDRVVKSNPKNSKYVNLVLLENSFYICEELSSLANQLKHPTRLNQRSIAGAAAA